MRGVVPGFVLLVSCTGHGVHTSELLDESTQNQLRLGAATNFDLASQQFQGGRMDEALESVDNSIELQGDVATSHALRSRILMELDRPQDALAAIDRALEIDAEDADLHYLRTLVLEGLGRLDEALASLDLLEEKEGLSARSLLAAVEFLIDLDRLDDARTRLAEAPLVLQQNPGVRQAQAHMAWMDGNLDLAGELFTQAVLMDSSDPELREDLFQVLIAQQRFAEAESTARWLAGQDGFEDRRDLQLMHASCLLELDRPIPARDILQRLSVGTGENDYDVWSRLVDVSALLDNSYLMDRASSRLLSIDGSRAHGYLARAWFLRRQGRTAEALQVLESMPPELSAHETLAALQTRLKTEAQDAGR